MAELNTAYRQIHPNFELSPNSIRKGRDGIKYQDCVDNREFTRLHDDPCERAYQHHESTKPLKYITRNFHDLGLNPQSTCTVGFLASDGKGIPRGGINSDSYLRVEKPLPRVADVQQLDKLPIHRGFQGRGCGDPAIEVDLKSGLHNRPRKSGQPRESDHEKRVYEYVDHLCYEVQDPSHIVLPDEFISNTGGVQGVRLGGLDSRHDRDVEDLRSRGFSLPIYSTRFMA